MANFDPLIEDLKQKDPRVYDALKLLIRDVKALNLEVFPPTAGTTTDQSGSSSAVPDIEVFGYELKLDSVRLFWVAPNAEILRYEIRLGNTWDTANSILTTDTLSAELDPILVGTTRFLIKAIGVSGLSVNARAIDVIVPALGGLSITASVIDNNVLLYWTSPTSTFRINHYVVSKGVDVIGILSGTFITIFEAVSGAYTYKVKAVDIAGNESPEASIVATVSQPPDYELRSDLLSDFSGTKHNVTLRQNGRLLCCTRMETWKQHFEDRAWFSIRNQIDAGFPLYIQPSETDGYYEEVIDYGLVINGTVATITYNTALISGLGVTVAVSLSSSLDNITYTSPIVTTNLFIASLRYLKVRIDFTALN